MSTDNTEDSKIPIMLLTNERSPMKAHMMMMLYRAAELGQLGYMDGKNPETGEIVPLLIGIEPNSDNTQMRVFPIGRIFTDMTDMPAYLTPDGQGGYMDATIKVEDNDGLPEREFGAEEEGPSEEGQSSPDTDGGALG